MGEGWGSWKIRVLERVSQKNNIQGGLPKKMGLGQFADLRGGGAWQEKGGQYF